MKSDNTKTSRIPLPMSHVKANNFADSAMKESNKSENDVELSQRYEGLKKKEQDLIKERESIFQSTVSSGGSTKKSSNMICKHKLT